MNKAFVKWSAFCAAGAALLVFAALCFTRGQFTWVFAGGFLGLFLISSGLKRIRLLSSARKAIKAGSKEIEIFYRDKNLKESREIVIPAGADTLWFYGYLCDRKEIKAFQWQGIKKVLENDKELQKDDVLNRLP